MKLSLLNNIILSRFRYLVIIALLFITSGLLAQFISDPYTIYIIGQLTDKENGSPIEMQEISCESYDIFNPDFIFEKTYFTDAEGFFYDTLSTNENKGAFIFYTTDYLGFEIDTVSYFRFTDRSECYVFVNFSIEQEITEIDYQANFSFSHDTTNQNPYLFYFFDKSNTDNIMLWNWDFGDGSYSDIQFPFHVFNEPGVYRVQLSITGFLSTNQTYYQSNIIKIVQVDDRYNYTLSGQVFYAAPPYLIDYGIAYLVEKVNEDYFPIDTMYFDNIEACYFFPALPEGDYLIKAGLQSISNEYGNYISTYYGNNILWQNADIIEHHSNNYDYNINLQAINYTGINDGIISGNVISDTVYRNYFIDGIEILLLNASSQPILCSNTDDAGKFIFDNLPYEEFNVYIDITGKVSQPIFLTLTEENPVISDLQITIGSEEIYGSLGIDEELIEFTSFKYGPNPVVNYLKLNFDLKQKTNIYFELYNNLGQKLLVTDLGEQNGMNEYVIDFSTFKNGQYYLYVIAGMHAGCIPILLSH